MTIDPALLNCLAQHFKLRNIPGVPASTINAWKAMTGLPDAHVSEIAERASLLLAAIAQPDLEIVLNTLGSEVANLVADLRPPASVNFGQRVMHWVKAVKESGDAADAGIRLLAAEAEGAGSDTNRQQLRDLLNIMADDANASERIRSVARKLAGDLHAVAIPGDDVRPEAIRLVSMSIDMAGSTEAKTRMLALAADDTGRHSFYTTLYKRFLNHEDRLYRALFSSNSSHHGSALDWRRLFVVKGIGDELWILYELNGTDDVSGAVRLLHCAIAFVEELINWSSTEDPDRPDFDPVAEEALRADHMELAYKIYMDLVQDALEISSLRAKSLESNVASYLGRGGQPFDADCGELAARLNAGFYYVFGNQYRRAFRTDYIGHEIDRFFRTSKAALPCVVTVGEALFDFLQPKSRLFAHPGLFHATIEYSLQSGNPRSWNELFFVRQTLAAADLKGIGYPYRVHQFATQHQLFSLWHAAESQDLVKPSLVAFPAELKDKMMTTKE